MSTSAPFLDALKGRRSIYALNKDAPIPDSKLEEILHAVVLSVPSSFNSQSTRLVVLLKKEHDVFWDMVMEVLAPHAVDDAARQKTNRRLGMFKAAYGSILFFEDRDPIQQFQKLQPAYADLFPDWSEQTSGMHQLALWTALEAEGFGANLQHYNPVVDIKAKNHWKIPMGWRLRAQLVFGGRKEPGLPPANEKTPVSETVRVLGK